MWNEYWINVRLDRRADDAHLRFVGRIVNTKKKNLDIAREIVELWTILYSEDLDQTTDTAVCFAASVTSRVLRIHLQVVKLKDIL